MFSVKTFRGFFIKLYEFIRKSDVLIITNNIEY